MRQLAISVVVVGLCACGSGAKIASGKQGAAEALALMHGQTQGASNPSGAGITLPLSYAHACPKGGDVNFKNIDFNAAIGQGASITTKLDAEYRGCSVSPDIGQVTLNGTISLSGTYAASSGEASVDQSLKGKTTFSGAIDDFLDVDVSEKLQASALAATSGEVSVVLKGTITNSSGTYTFDESVNVTAGKVTVAVSSTTR